MCRRVVFFVERPAYTTHVQMYKRSEIDSYQFIYYIAVNENKSCLYWPLLDLVQVRSYLPNSEPQNFFWTSAYGPRYYPAEAWPHIVSRDSDHSSQKHMPQDSTHCQYILSVYKLTPNWWKPKMKKGSKGSTVVVKSQSGQNTKLNQNRTFMNF